MHSKKLNRIRFVYNAFHTLNFYVYLSAYMFAQLFTSCCLLLTICSEHLLVIVCF